MGDCDNDGDCFRGFKCGFDNCWSMFGVGNWESKADCCYGNSKLLFVFSGFSGYFNHNNNHR